MPNNYTGILIAGGKSSRMGQDKGLTVFKEKKLIEYPHSVLSEFCDEILISSNSDKYSFLSGKIINDEIKDIGPISGIYSCLKYAKNEKCIILPCDTPFVASDLIENLLQYEQNYDVVICESEGKFEPAIGIYSKSITGFLENQIKSREFSLIKALSKINIKIVDIRKIPSLQSNNFFLNINTLDDLDFANTL